MSQDVSTNKKAFRDYFLTDKWECGIELKGGEVKSVRQGGVSFKDTHARILKDELFLYNLHINPYTNAGYEHLDPDRERKLLVRKRELRKMEVAVTQKKLTLVPTKVYINKRGLVKVEIALGKGKKLYDKRETIKNRKTDRDIQRALRNAQRR